MASPPSGSISPMDYRPDLNAVLRKRLVPELKGDLNIAGVAFPARALKPYLQALCVLTYLGHCKKDSPPDDKLLTKTTRWCRILVSELVIDMERVGIARKKNKWRNIEALVQHEISSPAPDLNDVEKGIEAAAAVLAGLEVSKKNDIYPHHDVINFIVTVAYSDYASQSGHKTKARLKGNWGPEDDGIRRRQITSLPPRCPATSSKHALELLDSLHAFESARDVSKVLKPPMSASEKMLAWLLDESGSEFVLAENELIIPGFPPGTYQFVLARPASDQQKLFETAFEKDNRTSIPLFHGTGIYNLRSILTEGLFPTTRGDYKVGVFMAEDLQYPYNHYAKVRLSQEEKRWKNDPFREYSLILGCEVTGNGRYRHPEGDYPDTTGTHVIRKVESIMVRYMFLIPPTARTLPLGADIKPAMQAAFKKIAIMHEA